MPAAGSTSVGAHHHSPTMPAAVNHGKDDLRVEQVDVPSPGPSDVLVEVGYCGICGSDLHLVLEGWGRPGGVGGHEWSGVVVDVGEAVGKWRPGDRVVGGPGAGCRKCDMCTTHRPSLCRRRATPGTGAPSHGAFATYTLVDEDHLVAVPPGLEMRAAALTEPLSVAVHACTVAGVVPGNRVLVSGAGPIGLLAVAVLKAWGITDVVVSEPGARRRQRSVEVGARLALAPEELERPPTGMPMDLIQEPFDAVLECSGNGTAQEGALLQLGRAGRLVLVGAGMGEPRMNANRILLNELVVTGSNEYWEGDFDRALDLLGSGQLPLELLIEHDEVRLDGLLVAMHSLAAGDLPGKVMVVPGR